ncbi:MAG: hypothetical protein SOT46_10595 [Treponema sp.]|nr:hypothetical protein [Spirochaetia bacterium]MDY2840803.1 hypothetical protein [Treponema sp.]
MENSPQQIQSAKSTIRQLLPLIEQAERKFKSARNWGFVDIFGGGLISDFIKHSHLNSASIIMNDIQHNLQILQQQLNGLVIPTDYRMQMGGFSTFGDFIFDGAVFDIYMQSKIMSSLEQVRDLKNKILQLDAVLNKM